MHEPQIDRPEVAGIPILIVDDNPANLIALEAVLTHRNYRLFQATSAESALELLAKIEFAVALLDVQMPRIDGFDLANVIRKNNGRSRNTPIIFLTAQQPNEEAVARGYKLGAVDFLFKPLNIDALKGKVSAFAELYRRGKADSEKRIMEEVYSFFQQSPAPMAVLSGPGHVFTLANSAYEKFFGRRVLGKKVSEAFSKAEAAHFIPFLDDVYKTGQPFVAKEISLTLDGDRDGLEQKYVNLTYHPFRDVRGAIKGISTVLQDVTEQVLARRMIEEANGAIENERENFRNLFKQTPEIVCILGGPDHVFEFVNEAHIRTIGFDTTGKAVREAQPDSVQVHGILDEVYRTGKTAELRQIAVTVGGRLRYFNLTFAARKNKYGEINGVMILGAEVTDQVKAATNLEKAVAERTRELNESRSFTDSVVENIPNMIFVKDAKELRFVGFNKAGEDLLGISRKEFLGKSDHDLFPKDQADYFVKKDREVLSGRTVLDVDEEVIHTRHMGQRLLHTRKIPVFGSDGRPEYLVGISEDITEKKKVESERLRAIAEQAALAERKRENERAVFLAEASTILASSLDYRETLKDLARMTVPAIADLCAITILRPDQSKERAALVQRDPKIKEELAGTDADVAGVIASREPLFVRSGEGRPSLMIVPILARENSVGAIAFVSSPLREYNEADLAIAKELGRRAGIAIENALLYESAQSAVKIRDEFMSIASHELRTPVFSLKLQAQVLNRQIKKGVRTSFDAKTIEDFTERVDRQLNTLAKLIDDMLDVSRIESGRLTMEFDACDLTGLVRDALSALEQQFKAAQVEVKADLEPHLTVHGAGQRLNQVISNLLTNAIKYGDGKPVVVTVCREGDFAVLKVKDHGLGIAPENLERIFHRFERAVSSRNISGLGLGLYIAKQIVEGHKGTIRVESELETGSTFEVRIPLLPEEPRP
jgi:PAS domain S-box-containing protein